VPASVPVAFTSSFPFFPLSSAALALVAVVVVGVGKERGLELTGDDEKK
jgi:hypothetical protein